jgi:hypothetical protein
MTSWHQRVPLDERKAYYSFCIHVAKSFNRHVTARTSPTKESSRRPCGLGGIEPSRITANFVGRASPSVDGMEAGD